MKHKHFLRRIRVTFGPHGRGRGLSVAVISLVALLAVFFISRGVSPQTSELAYIKNSSAGGLIGSVVPASCDSVPPYEHALGECTPACVPNVGQACTLSNSCGQKSAVGVIQCDGVCGNKVETITITPPVYNPYTQQTTKNYLSTWDDFRNGPTDVCAYAGKGPATGNYACLPLGAAPSYGFGRYALSARHNGNWQVPPTPGEDWCDGRNGNPGVKWVECGPAITAPPETSCVSAKATALSVSSPGGGSGSNSVYIPYNSSADLHWSSSGITGSRCNLSDGGNRLNSDVTPNTSGTTNTGPLTASRTYYFYCYDSAGNTTPPKSAYVSVGVATVNGACGSAGGTYSAAPPRVGQCSSGTASPVPAAAYPVCSASFYGYPTGCTAGANALWTCPSSTFDPSAQSWECGDYDLVDDSSCYVTTDNYCTTDTSRSGWGWSCLGSGSGTTVKCTAPSSRSTTPPITEPTTYSCNIYSLPENANYFAPPDNTGLTADTDYTHSAVGDTPKKCEFNCRRGYSWSVAARSCVLDDVAPPGCTTSGPPCCAP